MLTFRRRLLTRALLALSLSACHLAASLTPSDCTPSINDDGRRAILRYVRGKYKLPESIALELKDETLVGNSCYRQLSFEGKGKLGVWELTLYLSPDLRFLSESLLDTQLDPAEEERQRNTAVMMGLVGGTSATRGSNSAAVTLVAFSDFQCGYCKKTAEILEEVIKSEAAHGDLRFVFRHFPLPGHDWAQTAAEGAACAQLQNSSAFWSVHDGLFREQQGLSADNVKKTIDTIASTVAALDLQVFRKCMNDGMSLGVVMRDKDLGATNKVSATPTLYINGRRIEGVENASRLRALVAEARRELRGGAAAKPSAAPRETRGQPVSPIQ